jgi:hypothetical protein
MSFDGVTRSLTLSVELLRLLHDRLDRLLYEGVEISDYGPRDSIKEIMGRVDVLTTDLGYVVDAHKATSAAAGA